MNNDQAYAINGSGISEQAEPSTANRAAGDLRMRTLIELQVISMLLHLISGVSEDLHQIRQNVADSIT